jgi:hypothetical protein
VPVSRRICIRLDTGTGSMHAAALAVPHEASHRPCQIVPFLFSHDSQRQPCCRENGIVCNEMMYMADEEPSLAMHFEIIRAFKPDLSDRGGACQDGAHGGVAGHNKPNECTCA